MQVGAEPGAEACGDQVIEQGRGHDPGEDRPGPPKPGRQHQGQELRFVADLGQRDQSEGNQQGMHEGDRFGALSGVAADYQPAEMKGLLSAKRRVHPPVPEQAGHLHRRLRSSTLSHP